MGKFETVGSLLAASIVVGGIDCEDAEAKAKAPAESYERLHGLGAIDTGFGSRNVSNMPALKAYGPLEVSGRAMPYMGKRVDRRVGEMHKAVEAKDGNELMEFVQKVIKFVKENVAIVLEKAKAGR